MTELLSRSPEETFAIGRVFAADLHPGTVVLMYGGLGAGKTLFVKGAASALGYDEDEVTSPSFTLVNLYKTHDLDIYHIDLWRIEPGHNAAESVGLDEIVDNPQAVVLIEWADRLSKVPDADAVIRITITGDGDDARGLTIDRIVRSEAEAR